MSKFGRGKAVPRPFHARLAAGVFSKQGRSAIRAPLTSSSERRNVLVQRHVRTIKKEYISVNALHVRLL